MSVIGAILARGSSLWQSITGNTTTTTKFLVQTGDGVNSALPGWDLDLTLTVGSPGLDTNVPSEKAVRDAIASAGGGTVTSIADDGIYTENTPDPIVTTGTVGLTILSESSIDSSLHMLCGGI